MLVKFDTPHGSAYLPANLIVMILPIANCAACTVYGDFSEKVSSVVVNHTPEEAVERWLYVLEGE